MSYLFWNIERSSLCSFILPSNSNKQNSVLEISLSISSISIFTNVINKLGFLFVTQLDQYIKFVCFLHFLFYFYTRILNISSHCQDMRLLGYAIVEHIGVCNVPLLVGHVAQKSSNCCTGLVFL